MTCFEFSKFSKIMIQVMSTGEKFMFCCVGGCEYHGIWFVVHSPKIGLKISVFLTFSRFAVFAVFAASGLALNEKSRSCCVESRQYYPLCVSLRTLKINSEITFFEFLKKMSIAKMYFSSFTKVSVR